MICSIAAEIKNHLEFLNPLLLCLKEFLQKFKKALVIVIQIKITKLFTK